MMDERKEILLAINTADLDIANPAAATEAALARGHELSFSDAEIYEMLERLHDDELIERPEPRRSGSGEIYFYRVGRITQLGIDVAEAYLRTSSD